MAATRRIPGSKVQLSTCYGEDISGTGLAVQQPSGLLLIKCQIVQFHSISSVMKKVKGLQVLISHTEAPSSTPGCHDIHLVNLSYVENVKVEESSGEPNPHSEPDSVDQVHARYIAAVAEEKRKGINVTKAAQNIFNQLHKMYNSSSWRDKDITIPDIGVTIKPPYTVQDCVGGGEGLERVKKILQKLHEDQKIKSKP